MLRRYTLNDEERQLAMLLAEDAGARLPSQHSEIRAGIALRRLIGRDIASTDRIDLALGVPLAVAWTPHTTLSTIAIARSIDPVVFAVVGDWMSDPRIIALHGIISAARMEAEFGKAKKRRKDAPIDVPASALSDVRELWKSETPKAEVAVCLEATCRSLYTPSAFPSQSRCPMCREGELDPANPS